MSKFKERLGRSFVLILSFAALLQFCSCGIGTGISQHRGPGMFPQVGGVNLLGEQKEFPDCLEAPKTVVIVAFQRWQQQWVDEWFAEIEPMVRQEDGEVEYYEVPTIAKMTGPMRWWIYKGMQGGIPADFMRQRVVTLHIDKQPFKESLGIQDEALVYVYLMDEQGHILHREQGRFTLEKWLRLQEALQ